MTSISGRWTCSRHPCLSTTVKTGLVADDVNVLLGPSYFIRRGNPVVPALVQHFTAADWQAPEGLKTASAEELARGLPPLGCNPGSTVDGAAPTCCAD